MSDEELDHVLGGTQDIQPSDNFVSSVMAAVRSEAAVPPPIPFPWKRALPGLLVGLVACLFIAIETQQAAMPFITFVLTPAVNVTLWIIGALLMSLSLLAISMLTVYR